MKDTEKLINRYHQILRKQISDQKHNNTILKEAMKTSTTMKRYLSNPEYLSQLDQFKQNPEYQLFTTPQKALAVLVFTANFYKDYKNLPEPEKTEFFEKLEYETSFPLEYCDEFDSIKELVEYFDISGQFGSRLVNWAIKNNLIQIEQYL